MDLFKQVIEIVKAHDANTIPVKKAEPVEEPDEIESLLRLQAPVRKG